MLLNAFVAIDVFVLIFKNRYDWKKLKSDKYDPNKVQAIYSKPNTILSLLGAASSLSPKFNVRYSYNGKTIRFKKNNPNPIMVNTLIKETDIVKDTRYDGCRFNDRFEKIKHKKYNFFTFNCRSLLK
jgi:hypothetical protein